MLAALTNSVTHESTRHDTSRTRTIALTAQHSASQALIDLNFVPLDVTLRKRLIDLLNTVVCNNRQVYTTDYLVGVGPSLPLYTAWAVARGSTDVKVKYYLASATTEAAQQLASHDTDFGATDSGLPGSRYSLAPDIALLPVTAYAAVPGTHTPWNLHERAADS